MDRTIDRKGTGYMHTVLKSLLNLLIVAAVSVGLLWGADALTRSVIEKQETEAVRTAFSGMLDAARFAALDTVSNTAVKQAYRAEDESGRTVGYAVTVTVKGYGGRWRRMSLSPPTAAGSSACGSAAIRKPRATAPG